MSAVTPEASRAPTRPKRARTRTGAVGSGEYLVPRLSRSVVLGSVHLVKNGRSHRSSCTSSFHSTPAGRPTVETSRLSCAWIAHCQPEAEEILFLAYGIVTGKTDRDTLTLQTMIKDLHRHYPDYQATAVVKRSRMKARKEHLRHASELLP